MLDKNMKLVCAASKGIKYSCGECDYQSTSKGHLNQHQRAVHDGVKYTCRECGSILAENVVIYQDQRGI